VRRADGFGVRRFIAALGATLRCVGSIAFQKRR